MEADIYDIITTRKSTRDFQNTNVPAHIINSIITAGAAAPSGYNRCPWRFCVIQNKDIINKLSECMRFSKFISTAPCLIAVYYSCEVGYDELNDYLGIGAAMQNMLLCAQSNGYASCLVGESTGKIGNVLEKYYNTTAFRYVSLIAIGKPTDSQTSRIKHKTPQEVIIDKHIHFDEILHDPRKEVVKHGTNDIHNY